MSIVIMSYLVVSILTIVMLVGASGMKVLWSVFRIAETWLKMCLFMLINLVAAFWRILKNYYTVCRVEMQKFIHF